MTPTPRAVQPTFVRLDARNGWLQAETSRDVFADRSLGGLRLGSESQRAIPLTELGGTFGGLTRPTGLAVGPNGRLFLADPGGNRILGYTPHQATFLPLWRAAPDAVTGSSLSPYALKAPRGVAFGPDGDLVVADTGHGRIIVYAWPHLVPRHVLQLEEGSEPWDIAYDARGRLYVADAEAARIRRFDRLWRADEEFLGGRGDLVRPRHLAIDADDRLFVLDEGRNAIVALDARGRALPTFDPAELQARLLPPPLRLDGDGLWLLQDVRPACPALSLPGIEVDRGGRLQTIGAMLLARPRGVIYPRAGVYLSQALDSGIFNCAWHRIVLDADVPATTTLTVRTLTAAALLDAARVERLPLSRWSTPITIAPGDLPELLIQGQPGRYLWVRLEFGSNGDATPLVRALTLYAPRRSSLAYLPPVYHDDAVSADFLDRFLSYFDTVFAEIETQIDRFTGYLDPDAVPAGDFLVWLGSWLDITFLAEWSEATRRAFVRRAIDLYKQRGTVAGLQEILRLHTGLRPPQPIVIEHFRLRDYGARRDDGGAQLVDGTLYIAGRPLRPRRTAVADEIAHHFTLVLPRQAVPDDEALETVLRLLHAQKPAHTKVQLRIVEPGMRIGCQSTVGVDMLIGDYPSAPLGDLILGQSGQLGVGQSKEPTVGFAHLAYR